MNKSELIEKIAETADLPKTVTARFLDAFTSTVIGALKEEDFVSLVGFGMFFLKDRAARMGRNPQTGAPIEIKASKIPAFKPGKLLKDAVQ